MMEAKGLLANIKRIEDAEEQLLHIMDVIEGRLVQALAGLLAIKLLQNHTCACREKLFTHGNPEEFLRTSLDACPAIVLKCMHGLQPSYTMKVNLA